MRRFYIGEKYEEMNYSKTGSEVYKMATAIQIAQFIERIAPCAQHAYKVVGKVLPSVCIGMACVESAYGTAGSAKHSSYLGQKVGTGKTATKYWNGKFFKTRTKEEYVVGIHTVITDAFRSYDDMQQCVLNYYELLNTKLYARVQAGADYKTQMQQIKTCGYMTSSTEVNSVIRIIEKYNLTQYDSVTSSNVSKPKSETNSKTNNPYPVPKRLLRKGCKGEDVRFVQYALNERGYNILQDGIWGNQTEKAVLDFQKSRGLKTDAIVGKLTIAELLK